MNIKMFLLMVLPTMIVPSITGGAVQVATSPDVEVMHNRYVTEELLRERIRALLGIIDVLNAKVNNLNQQFTVLNAKMNALANQ